MIKKILALSIALCSVSSYAFTQGGDISVGAKVAFDEQNSVVSYYKEGNSGIVMFTCYLEGNNAKGFLFGGKNFAPNTPEILVPGINGPYTWTLRDLKEANGNIKVQLTSGTEASVMCRQVN